MEDSIKIYFEKIYPNPLPGAFFDKVSKTYDNFELSTQTTQMTVHFEREGDIELEWQDEEEEEPIEFPTNGTTTEPDPVPLPNGPEHEIELLRREIKELEYSNKELSLKIADYEIKESGLSKQILELQSENEQLKAFPEKSTTDTNDEIDHLKTLITQLVDNKFDGDYIKTQDSKINEMTTSIAAHRKTIAEKEASLLSLKQEEAEVEQSITDIKQEITHAMDNIHKAEEIKKEQSIHLSDVQSSLQEILADIDMDIDTLEMYSEQDSIGSIIAEARNAKGNIEEKLKSFVLERQKECDERSKRIQSS